MTSRSERKRPAGEVSLSPKTWALIDRMAEEQGTSRSCAIETLVRDSLVVAVPRHAVEQFSRLLGEIAESAPTGIDPTYGKQLRAMAEYLREVLDGAEVPD